MAVNIRSALVAAAVFTGAPALAQDSDAELAKKLSNPVASLISVPFQFNYDCCFGPSDGARETLNIQPVLPVSMTKDWNLIIRTITPLIYQEHTAPQTDAAYGFGDITQSFFFSPKKTSNGITWAIGPVFLWPIGPSELGTKKWAAGPTALVLKQDRGWTYGVLANHLWSYADVGDYAREDLSQTFVQPFLTYTTATHVTYGLNTESSYNWKTGSWTVPVNATVAKLYNFGGQRVQLTAGGKVYLASEDQGPGWGLRFVATFLFPK
jgi:hypothetical protein